MFTTDKSFSPLKVLGATEDEVHIERAFILCSSAQERSATDKRAFVEFSIDTEEELAALAVAQNPKVERVLGMKTNSPLNWLNFASDKSKDDAIQSSRVLRTKALKTLGATIDDIRIEKALLVLGEATGREVPAGKLPRAQPPMWAVPPRTAEAVSGVSVFLLAVLPWGVLAPLNILKLQLNKVSPGAHLWVPSETEQCQAACGIARMWATLFWSMQFANACACLYLHYNRERGLALLGASHKICVGAILLKAYLGGVIYWPIGLAGCAVEWVFALLFLRELRLP